jgi:RHS repeat-associated protein
MRTTWAYIGLLIISISATPAQIKPVPPTESTYSVSGRGPHHKAWERIEYEPAIGDKLVPHRRVYEELATGLHFKNALGDWEESREEIEILPNNAGAMASKGQHKVVFPTEIKSGLIELQKPDGLWLRSRVWGLAYFDASTGESVLLAEVKESDGQVVGDNVVVYPDAFTDLRADLRLTYFRSGFEQDVVLRTRPPAPEEFGLNPRTTRLQVLTEFVEASQPTKSSSQAGELADQSLAFGQNDGQMTIGAGKAFSVDGEGETTGHVPVAKGWEQMEGRDFLIEEVLYEKIADQLQKLPAAGKYEGASLQRRGTGKTAIAGLQKIMPKRYAKAAPKPATKRMAKAAPDFSPGFVMDYLITLTSQTNYTFKGDTTYHVTGPVILSGTSTFEGNAAIKYSIAANAGITASNVVWQSASYRPVYFTSMHDDSVGEPIDGSSGDPTTSFAGGIALNVSAQSNPVITNARFSYLSNAVAGVEFTFQDVQFLHCKSGLTDNGYGVSYSTLRNVLIYHVGTFVDGGGGGNLIRAENVTARYCGDFSADNTGSTYLTNCLFVCVTNWQASNTITNHSTFLNSDIGVFQTAGGGTHYLSTNSPYRNAGTTNLNASLLANLKQKTTYPPIVYTDTDLADYGTLGPQATRDTDIPDLGYHYDPLDYLVGKVNVNYDLTFSAGTAVGWFRHDSDWYHAGHGLHVADSKTLSFAGQQASLCHYVHQITAQEGLVGYTPFDPGPGGITGWASSKATQPKLNLQFTRFALPVARNHIRDDNGSINVSANHCEFYGGALGGYVSDYGMTNCLLDRVQYWLSSGNTNYADLNSFRNCTIHGGAFYSWRQAGNVGRVKMVVSDTVFDDTSIDTADAHYSNAALTAFSFNAFRTNANRTTPTNVNDVIVTNFNWQTSWLGNFYLPTNSPLINTGSVAATSVGLYHFTSQTNQVKETNSTVDIGYHYVAVNANGVPLDTDSDGLPDYIEDADGDGVVDAGETSWGLAISTQPQSQTAIACESVTLSVIAAGVTPFSYQWKRNGANIAGATSSNLTFNPVSATNAATYSVVVTNVLGTITSSNAVLTVVPVCTTIPSGLVGWWRGENNTSDTVGTNNGSIQGGVSYTNGMVGQAFKFNGTSGKISIPDAPALRPTNFTLEAWVYPTALPNTPTYWRTAILKAHNNDNLAYGLYAQDNGAYSAGRVNAGGSETATTNTTSLPLNAWTHLATTYDGAFLKLYVNGALVGNRTKTGAIVTSANPLWIGGNDPWNEFFTGLIDEASLYNRALSSNEVAAIHCAGSAGKCIPPPTIITPPANRLAQVGDTVVISAVASGLPPLTYQWYFNGTNVLSGATNTTLTLNNVQTNNSGGYSVVVSNHGGSVTSITATLTVRLCFEAVDVALVIDRSGSMTEPAGSGLTRIEAARTACSNFVQSMSFGSDQAALVTFATDVTTNQTLTSNVPLLLQKIGQITNITGETFMTNALLAAQTELTSIRRNSNALPVLVFLTDGAPDDSTNAILAVTTQIKNTGTRLITVGLGTDLQTVNLDLLRAMATTTNNFYHATNTAQLTNVYYLIADSICRGETNQPSVIEWLTPTNTQLFVISPTNILLRATNKVGLITKMMFYNGSNYIGETNAPPYEFLWTNVSAGTYSSLQAIGVNSSTELNTTNTISINVNAMPEVAITSPTNIQEFDEVTNVTVLVTATDDDGNNTITNVAFYSGTNHLGNDISLPYTFVWSNLTHNFYPVTAVATDELGASTTSRITVFEVVAANDPPEVWITYPTNLAAFPAGIDITIAASVSTGSGLVTNVEFFVDGRLLGHDTEAPYNITECCWKSGIYVLTAKVQDDLGASGVSANITIVVGNARPTAGDGIWDPEFSDDINFTYAGGLRAVAAGSNGEVYVGGMAFGNGGTEPQFFGDDGWYVVAKWDGVTWSGVFPSEDGYDYNRAQTIVPMGDSLYIGGERWYGGGASNYYSAGYVVKLDGTNWIDLGDKLPVRDYEGGSNPRLGVTAIKIVGSDIFVTGDFDRSENNSNVQFVARLAGTNWVPVGNGLTMPTNGAVRAIAYMGTNIYIGGDFTAAGGNTNIQYLAKLTGNAWTNVGDGVNGIVRTLAVCQDDLYVGGDFDSAGGISEANCIAKWSGGHWDLVGRGVAGGLDSSDVLGYSWAIPSVHTISVHGGEVFVGGEFSTVYNGSTPVSSPHVAKATWDEQTQGWIWSALEGGVYYEDLWWYPPDYVTSSTIYQPPGTNAYDVYFAGRFSHAGLTWSGKVGRWQVGSTLSTNVPNVNITSPTNFASFNETNDPITLTATAIASGTNTIDQVDFYSNGEFIGTGIHVSGDTYSFDWNSVPFGLFRLKAVATDSSDQAGESPVVIILNKSTNNTLVATADTFTIIQGAGTTNFNVLANDTPTGNGLRVSDAYQVQGALYAQVRSSHDGSSVSYTPNPNLYGEDVFEYAATNSIGGVDAGVAAVKIRARPGSILSAPNDGSYFKTNTIITLTGAAWDWDGTATNVQIYVNGETHGSGIIPTAAGPVGYKTKTSGARLTTFAQPANNFSVNWTTNEIGFYTFTAVTTCEHGINSTSAPVTIVLTNTVVGDMPIAQITNLVGATAGGSGLESTILPVIRDGLFQLRGRAFDPDISDTVSYQVLLYRPGDWETVGDLSYLVGIGFEPYADVTPGAKNYQGFHIGGDVSGSLSNLDLTAIPNGVYDLVLRVRGGTDETNAIVRVMIESNLKIGQFSFSEQDLVLPVNGIPLTVTRTYNSLNPRSAEFGYSWSYALNSMDVEIDEERVMVTAVDTLEDVDLPAVNPMNFSMRVGGGRNVTLTLPDGRRTTFQFTYAKTTSGEDCPSCYDGEWIAPAGVTAKLTTLNPATKQSTGDDTVIALFSPLQSYWQAGGPFTPLEAYDIPELVLTTDDGTEYHITRDADGEEQPTYIYYDEAELFADNPSTYYIKPHPGKPKLSWIKQRSEDIITISDTGITHYPPNSSTPTRSAFIERGEGGRIVAIRDPNSGSNGLPVMKYIYNRDTGNLIQVHRLQDRAAGNYLVTKYHYDHPNPEFAHYITSIEDPRGIPLARNEYDDSGRLTAVVDADGKRTQFIHNTTNRVEIVTDRLGNTNSFAYDTRGNVTATTNALNQVTTMAYDDFNNKTNDVVFLNGQPYATNHYVYDTSDPVRVNLLLATVNGLGHSNTFVYGQNGRLEISTDARGFSTTNYYDNDTDLLIATSDALGNVSSNYYNGGLLVGTRDALGTLTTNIYDASGNLTAMAVLGVSGKILSTNSFTYDANGNQTNSVTWRTNSAGGGWLGATNTTIYDAQNRAVQTVAPDGGVNSVVYNALGKQDYTVDALNYTNRFAYDAQGRMYQTIYADGSTNLSHFDAEGRLTNSVDQAGRSTIYYYDSLGRMTNTVFADNTTNRTYYDGLGRVQLSVNARGVTNAFGYDVLGQRTSATNALGVSGIETVSRYGYDANGNQIYFTNALGVVTTNLYDALSRLTNVSFSDGTKQLMFYDADGRRIASVDQANATNRFVYDGVGRLTFVTNALGKVTRFEYDEAGNQTAEIDALNRTNKFEFNAMSQRVKRILAGNQSETFSYDFGGNLIRHTNFNAVVITNQYDALNRLTNRTSVSGYQVRYGYSVTGQRTNMVDASGTSSYAYDVRNRLTNCVNAAGELHYRYDAAGNLTNLWSATADGVNVRYTYDGLSRLKTVTNVVSGTPGLAALYGYDGVGNLQTIQYGNNLTNHYRYDSLNRLTNVLWKLTTTTHGDFTYKLGLAGNRTNLIETVNNVSRTNTWQHDAAYRLTNETIGVTASTGALGYNYDDVGNRLTRTSTLGSLGSQTFTFDKSDRLDNDSDPVSASSLFDANGNTTSYGGTYQYDVENRLLNANSGTVVIVYDGDGNRIKKTVGGVTTWYLVATVNPAGYAQVVEEKTGTTPATLSRVYTYGHDLVNQRESGGTVYYFGYDGHGSTRFLMNGSAVANMFAYDAYGTLIASNTTAQTAYLYCGEQFDTDLGFYYLRARYMNPTVGRFHTLDTFEGDSEEPISLHKYLYAHNNPVDRVDPTGYKSSFSRADAAAIGREVHKRLGRHFVSGAPSGTRVTAESVFTILGLPNPRSGAKDPTTKIKRLFPDLVDIKNKEIYEIKPISIGGTAAGAIQLGSYVLALNKLDPSGGWHVAIGPEHYNSLQVFFNHKPFAAITVYPPVFGIVYYKVETVKQFAQNRAKNAAQADTARLQQHMGIATLNSLLLGI